jgi:hypothetical protein
MGKGKAQRLQIWPNSADGIEIEATFCHSDYELSVEASAVATPSKLLRLFSVVPKTSSDPTFFGRYDARDDLSGRNQASAVDVDALGLTDAEEKDFKAGKNRFSGHHSTRTKDGQHQILISTPKHGKIFEGTLSMKASARGELLDILDLKISDSLQIYNADTGEVLFDSQPTPPNK